MNIETRLNEIIVSTVLKNIPKNLKPVSFLMDLFDLSRESVYRRIRGEIPFTIEEIVKLSINLGFSVDEIIEGNKRDRVFFDLQADTSVQPQDAFLLMCKNHHAQLLNIINAENKNVLVALNNLPAVYSASFNNLFRFFYYEWLQHNHDGLTKLYYSDVIISPELASMQEKIIQDSKKSDNSTIILSPNLFLNLIRNIQYYHKRKLITDEELQLLKEDIANLIDSTEKVAKTGALETTNRVDIYLSTLSINSNIAYIKYGNNIEAHLLIHPVNPIIIHNPEVCAMQKNWLYCLKKHSRLITQSNEILQTFFFDKQREYLEKIL